MELKAFKAIATWTVLMLLIYLMVYLGVRDLEADSYHSSERFGVEQCWVIPGSWPDPNMDCSEVEDAIQRP